MNANELSDELENTYPFVGVMEVAATMLRQQQAEIEALKAAKIRAYNNGVEDGRKPDTNNEPVAWMSKKGILSYVNDMGFTIPLYTHPVKELTDEEIAGAVARGWCSEKNSMKVMDSDLAWAIVEEIKAILRKAQENDN